MRELKIFTICCCLALLYSCANDSEDDLIAIDDTIDETPNETINATITSITGQNPTGTQTVSLEIADNDEPTATLSVNDNLTQISEDGGVAQILVTLSSETDIPTIVNLDYSGGTAVLGENFVGPSKVRSQQISCLTARVSLKGSRIVILNWESLL